ncbi:Uncharacterised protein [Salmonella enterica subsp. enterica serovar Typhi]|nr:Uncharacterised protein [Salmonella enterica subsp. enterica serovar Typhi]CHM46793.1 Uncharacterised protein [Salmonella enterica subsp. enterica serovar Typhi]
MPQPPDFTDKHLAGQPDTAAAAGRGVAAENAADSIQDINRPFFTVELAEDHRDAELDSLRLDHRTGIIRPVKARTGIAQQQRANRMVQAIFSRFLREVLHLQLRQLLA